MDGEGPGQTEWQWSLTSAFNEHSLNETNGFSHNTARKKSGSHKAFIFNHILIKYFINPDMV